MGKPWENIGKIWENMEKPWENMGKIWENMKNYGKDHGKNQGMFMIFVGNYIVVYWGYFEKTLAGDFGFYILFFWIFWEICPSTNSGWDEVKAP